MIFIERIGNKMLDNEHLMKLLIKILKQTYKIYWLCYDWKHEGIKPLVYISEDIKYNFNRRKWIKEKIQLLKKEHLTTN